MPTWTATSRCWSARRASRSTGAQWLGAPRAAVAARRRAVAARRLCTEAGRRRRQVKAHELVALGASVGANSHPLLELHIATALEAGLSSTEVAAALKMAEYVQQRAGEMTAEKATHVLEERVVLQ